MNEDVGADPRYPYTYSADLIRMVGGYNKNGTKLSRADASAIRQLIVKVMDLNDWDVADELASYYLDNEEEITDAAVKRFVALKKLKGEI